MAVAVTALSNRLHTKPIPFAEDRISSLKDDEWNKKLLELFAEGRLEDVSQLARTFSQEARLGPGTAALRSREIRLLGPWL